VNWDSAIEPVPVAEVYTAIDAHDPEGLVGEAVDQLIAAKDGAKATIAELGIPDGMLVGVEFAGTTGTDPLPVVTTRVRQVEPPPEPEVAQAEEGEVAEEEALAPA
jgi:hypothetical protein